MEKLVGLSDILSQEVLGRERKEIGMVENEKGEEERQKEEELIARALVPPFRRMKRWERVQMKRMSEARKEWAEFGRLSPSSSVMSSVEW